MSARRGPLAPHYLPLAAALRCGVELAELGWARSLPRGFPLRDKWLVLIGDDLPDSLGPVAFDRGSLRRAPDAASHVVIYSGPPAVRAYEVAALAAVIGGHVAIVETEPSRHKEWTSFADAHAGPGVPFLDVIPDALSADGVSIRPRSRK